MKSSAMLQSLQEAQENESAMPFATLDFYLQQGNFAVREFIQHLIADRSPVVGSLPINTRLNFLLAFIRESFNPVTAHRVRENARIFLNEIDNYNLQGDARRYHLQQFITLLEELRGDTANEEIFPIIILTDELVRLFPETADNRLFTYSPTLASYVAESAVIYASRPE